MREPALTAPMPWYGGKRHWAGEIWQRFGDPRTYAEFFGGSLSVMFARPGGAGPRELATDTNGYAVNFYRAVRADWRAVTEHAVWPTFHTDLTARHAWLLARRAALNESLLADPEWSDAKAAGWWVWGASSWIGGEWCAGPESAQVPSTTYGKGVSAQRVSTKVPAVNHKSGGRGVSAQRAGAGAGTRDAHLERVGAHLRAIADRLHGVVLLNRPWRSLTSRSMLGDTASHPSTSVAVLVDPPYLTGPRHAKLYASDHGEDPDAPARESYAWAVEHGERYRVAYCCHAGDFPVPDGWTALEKSFRGVHDGARKGARDQVMFSPACLGDAQGGLFVE